MRLSSRRFKFLGISTLALLIFIPLLVFGAVSDGFRSLSGNRNNTTPVYHYQDDSLSVVALIGCCLANSSGNDYFVPTRTLTEWNAFFNHQPSGVTPVLCCGDHLCSGSDTCNNCTEDCGACSTCTNFTYSAWSGCCNGTQTRSVVSQGPAFCTGGSPVTSQTCSSSVSGCISGTCRNGYIYLNSGYCYGGSISQTNVCISSSVPNSSCIYGSEYNSQYYVPSGGCSYSVACSATPGCPGGYSCRSGSLYLNSSSCTGNTANLSSVCIANTDPNNTCLSYNSITSVIYTPGSGCSY